MLLKANILAKASFLEQIPNLAYAFTAIDMWLKTFFAMPALDSSASKGVPPPPSTNMAKCAGGRSTGVMGKLQTHLITTFFHAMPRGQPPATIASQPSNSGAESTAASSSSNSVKLAHQHNWASQAGPRTQSTSAADHTITSPAGQQCVGTPSTSRTAAEAPPSAAGLDVQEETISPPSRRHGGHDLWDERELYRSPRHRPLGRGGAAPPLPHRSSMRMQERPLPKMDSWKTLHAPTPAPATGQPEHPAVHLHGDQHGSHRLRPEPPPGPDGRRDRGSSEAEPADRTSTKTVAIDGKCQS